MPVGRTTINSGDLDASFNSLKIANGGVVTQITTRSTGVTINTRFGQITTDTTSLAGLADASFVVTNDKVKLTSIVVASIATSPDADSVMEVHVEAIADGSFTLRIKNTHATNADTGAMVINFVVIEGSLTSQ